MVRYVSPATTSVLIAWTAMAAQAQIPMLPQGRTAAQGPQTVVPPQEFAPGYGATFGAGATYPPPNAAPSSAAGPDPVLDHCVVKLIDQVIVSVQEPGLLTALEVREGMTVEADTLVGRVSDGQARMAKLVADAELKIARRRAENDVDVRFAESAAKVAEFEYRAALQANARSANSISSVKLQELALAFEKAQRQIEQSQHNQSIARDEAEAKRVAVEAADDDVRRRQIVAPISGEVVEVPVHVGEFVKPGDAVLRLVRLDQLAVEGFLQAAEYEPSAVINRPVVVQATLARGRRMQFPGKITFVHPEIDGRGQFRIKAQVANFAENGQFLLRPGQEVEMTVRFSAGAETDGPGPLASPDNGVEKR